MFEERNVDCYILNTGHFLDRKIPKEVTINIIENIVDETAEFKDFGHLKDMKTIDIEGFEADFKDRDYLNMLKDSMANRIKFLESLKELKGGRDQLPEEAVAALKKML